ncbi:MAG: acetolactate synthase small subunit [Acholeplasmatales bacterium]|nr:acetolactate synthase small subunit [Acholeplasmatales bacterium]
MARHTLSVLVNNHMGVLSRVAGLFSRRGFNIESLAVGETEDPGFSRMTIVTSDVDDETYNQIKTQLEKLMDVVKIHEADKVDSVVRELALIKIDSKNDKRSQILELVNIFRAHVLDVTSETLMIEITGDSEKISAIISMLDEFGVKEVIRTGAIAIARGSSELKK